MIESLPIIAAAAALTALIVIAVLAVALWRARRPDDSHAAVAMAGWNWRAPRPMPLRGSTP